MGCPSPLRGAPYPTKINQQIRDSTGVYISRVTLRLRPAGKKFSTSHESPPNSNQLVPNQSQGSSPRSPSTAPHYPNSSPSQPGLTRCTSAHTPVTSPCHTPPDHTRKRDNSTDVRRRREKYQVVQQAYSHRGRGPKGADGAGVRRVGARERDALPVGQFTLRVNPST